MKQFKRIYIEITNVCNMSCSFCSKMNRKKEFMSEETFRRILTQVKPYTDYIYFHVKGEPLMHPLVGRFLDISHEMGMTVNMTTNGTLLAEKKGELLGKKALRQINISLHSFENGTEEDFDSYIDSVIDFAKEVQQSMNTYVVMRLWNLNNTENPQNIKVINKLEKAFSPENDVKTMIENAPKNKLSERSLTLSENIYLSQEHEFKWPNINDEFVGASGFCYGLRSMAAILADGTVVPCCLDGDGSAALGNIHKDDFSDIISSDLVKNIYDGFSGRKVIHPLCQRCTYRLRFNRKKKIYKVL